MGILLFLQRSDLLAEFGDLLAAQLSELFGVNAISVHETSTTSTTDLKADDPK